MRADAVARLSFEMYVEMMHPLVRDAQQLHGQGVDLDWIFVLDTQLQVGEVTLQFKTYGHEASVGSGGGGATPNEDLAKKVREGLVSEHELRFIDNESLLLWNFAAHP